MVLRAVLALTNSALREVEFMAAYAQRLFDKLVNEDE